MKRTERHHLKDNELARIAASARQMVEARRGQATAIGLGLVIVLALIGGYFAWTGRVSARAGALLADAEAVDDARVGPPPAPGSPAPAGLNFLNVREKYQAALTKYKLVVDEYPGSEAALFATYRLAAAYMALGEPANAAAAYQKVIDRSGDNLYGQVARLGLAETQAQTGQYDLAIAAFKGLAERKDGQVPVDGILLRLGRTYLEAGKQSDAEQTFNRIVNEFPDSPFITDAQRELDQLKKT